MEEKVSEAGLNIAAVSEGVRVKSLEGLSVTFTLTIAVDITGILNSEIVAFICFCKTVTTVAIALSSNSDGRVEPTDIIVVPAASPVTMN